MAISANDVRTASGEFVLSQDQGNVTIRHGLNSRKIFVVAQRCNADGSPVAVTGSRYRSLAVIGATPELLNYDLQQSYTFDGGTEQTISETVNNAYPLGIYVYPGVSTSSAVAAGMFFRTTEKPRLEAVSESEITIDPNYLMLAGRWVWRCYKCD